jgi:hypothetical protein
MKIIAVSLFLFGFILSGFAQEKQINSNHISPEIKTQIQECFPKFRSVIFYEEVVDGKRSIEAEIKVNRKDRVTLVFQNNQFIESEIEIQWRELSPLMRQKILNIIDSFSTKYSFIELEKISLGNESKPIIEYELMIDSKQPQSEIFELRINENGELLRISIRYKQVIQSIF